MPVDSGTADRMARIRQILTISDGRSALPDRVKRIIADEDRTSEYLVGCVQLVIALLLTLLYLLSPAPVDASAAGFKPVPYALGAFLGFSLLRLWLILKGSPSNGFVVFAIAVDIALLIGLIWSFHIQYQQPPGFSLKAPTFVYLFVFVVVRSLRFEPRHVVLAGLIAAVGWMTLTIAAIATGPPGAVTRNFSEYITSTRILVGAEFDKVFALLMATFLLALGASRAQRILVSAIKEQTAVNEIQRFLSRGVAEQIASADDRIEAGAAIERDVAVIMIDIRGFTRLAMRLPPRDVVAILTSLHARIIPVVRRNGGVVDKFLGDGVMVTFGAVTPSSTPAANGLRALEDIIEECRVWEQWIVPMARGENLKVNAALAHGTAVFATLGDGDRLEYTVIGEAVNLAAKLEKHNKIEESRALAPSETVRAARSQNYVPRLLNECRKMRTVGGVGAPVDLMVWRD
ncbi:MAG: adenylate/guanylate cyclase domain-containing protein [Hyphomicrobium sp.]|nr:adenylate/guanylate cyclase domain-containing protein [Hyphomicrobium sp.]